MSLLECSGVKKIYNSGIEGTEVYALQGIELKVRKGEFIGIMGASGSGKTTLLNILSGIIEADEGSTKLNNNEYCDLSRDDRAVFRKENFGVIFQDFNLLKNLTIEENIMLPMAMMNLSRKNLREQNELVMKELGILKLRDKYPHMISGGEQQRVAIARAIIKNPEIIFADEPTGNLDSKSSEIVMNNLSNINNNQDTSILMVTHDPVSASYCDRVIFIKDGKVGLEIWKENSRGSFLEKIKNCQCYI